ncbi:MAG: nucleotidyltransferase family protein [Candidatus Hydrogenedentes bacterium]|nr:nucleotidyltransferase family protein [Candidatus Hydrogenedentota bacterium]
MITRKSLNQYRDDILDIAQRYGAHDIRIFGSVARGDNTESSDLDLIVRFDPGRSLFDHGEFLMDLQELLGVKVDIISEGGMRPRFRQHVMQEVVPL